MTTRMVAGCMTGTSMDGIDVALVEITGTGLGLSARLVRTGSRTLGALTDGLRALAAGRAMNAHKIRALARGLGEAHLTALGELIAGERIDLIAAHGQTILHQPPLSWQLLDPSPIAYGLGIPVVFDLRAADLAAGGQGAPITPLADYLVFRSSAESRAICNLGGFANVTILPTSAAVSAIKGADLCAVNHLLDGIARQAWSVPFDENGARASAGRVRSRPYAELAELLMAQSAAGRSLGTDDELDSWIKTAARANDPADLARTVAAAIARVIAEHTRSADRLLLAGGGARNRTLVEEIAGRAGCPVELTDAHGVPIEAREAMHMAVLGALCQDREPITLSQVTGCATPEPIAGYWVLP